MTMLTIASRVSALWKNCMLRLAFTATASAFLWQPLGAFAAPTAPAPPYPVQTADDIENLLNLDERKIIQEGLIWSGVYTGGIDGNFEKDTRDAIAVIQQQYQQPETGRLSTKIAARLYQLAQHSRNKFGWETYIDPRTGVTLSYPEILLAASPDPRTGAMGFVSDDKKIVLQMVNQVGVQFDAIDALYKQTTENSKSNITYKLKNENMFVSAGERGAVKHYSRYEQRGDEIRGYDLIWFRERDTEVKILSPLIANSFAFGTLGTSDPFLKPHGIKFPHYPYLGGLSREITKQTADTKASPLEQQAPVEATPDGLGPRFSYSYEEFTSGKAVDAYRVARKSDLLRGNIAITALDGMFMTQHPLRYIARPCRVDADYNPEESAVFMCYEVVDYLLRQANSLYVNEDPAFRLQYIKARLQLILLHATGHALIDLLKLPPPMNVEEAVDQLVATLILLGMKNEDDTEELTHMLAMNAAGLKADPSVQPAYTRDYFSEEHAWNEERYSNVLCMIYGSDPKKYASIIDQRLLPESRAASCREDAPRKYEAWVDFLSPYFAPRYQKTISDSAEPRMIQ
ncbi:peptidoglycan-binding protein [Pseudomonas viridiflava]|nr:peptidoglycan-binding protein [Pseudomonas viridiflava]